MNLSFVNSAATGFYLEYNVNTININEAEIRYQHHLQTKGGKMFHYEACSENVR